MLVLRPIIFDIYLKVVAFPLDAKEINAFELSFFNFYYNFLGALELRIHDPPVYTVRFIILLVVEPEI